MSNKRILIVEDNPSHAKLEKLALAGSGYDIRIANNAEEALKAIKEFEPQLILMDIQLPGMDGLVLTRQIKADSKYRYITIVAITAYGMKGDKEMALEAGCNAYMAKPLDVEKFPEDIKNYLNKIGVDSDGNSTA